MTRTAPRTNADRAALDAEVLALIASQRIFLVDGDGNLGPKALAFALDLPLATVRASIRRLEGLDRIVSERPDRSAPVSFWRSTEAQS